MKNLTKIRKTPGHREAVHGAVQRLHGTGNAGLPGALWRAGTGTDYRGPGEDRHGGLEDQHALEGEGGREGKEELIIGGLGKIDTEDWKTNTRLKVRNTYLSILLKSIQWWWRKNYDLDTFRAHLRTRGEQWKIDTEDWRTNTRLKVRKSRGREGKEKQWKIDTEELI